MQFLIHAPRRGATQHLHSILISRKISIHTPRGGSDSTRRTPDRRNSYFNPRSPWGERRNDAEKKSREANFNPRSPWGERPSAASDRPGRSAFQSTLPVGGATQRVARRTDAIPISIHAPRGGSDATMPRRSREKQISIHAPRGGSDHLPPAIGPVAQHFNPRSPWGERLNASHAGQTQFLFQSTLPVGGATQRVARRTDAIPISIHAPRGGSDLCTATNHLLVGDISIHAPRGGSDTASDTVEAYCSDFNPRSPWGERQYIPQFEHFTTDFNPRSPWGERHLN